MRDMNLYWCSWIQKTSDHRPVTYPPNDGVIGWWCSGYDGDDWAILCAWVKAKSQEAAFDVVKQDWPEIEEWRFCEQKLKYEASDRFPTAGTMWMQERVDALMTVD